MNNHKIIKPGKNGNGVGQDRKVPKALGRAKKPEAEGRMGAGTAPEIAPNHKEVVCVICEEMEHSKIFRKAFAQEWERKRSAFRQELLDKKLLDVLSNTEGEDYDKLRVRVKGLLETGADPAIRDAHGKSVLMYAAEGGHAEIVKMLLDAATTADICIANASIEDSGKTVLMHAAEGGHAEIVKMLLDDTDEIATDTDYNGLNALYYAASNQNMESYRILLERARVKTWHKKIRETLLNKEAIGILEKRYTEDNEKEALNLVGAEADINGFYLRETLLVAAARNGYAKVVKLLIGLGADIDRQGEEALLCAEREEALLCAEQERYRDIIRMVKDAIKKSGDSK